MAMNFRIPCTPNQPCDEGRPLSGTGPCLLHTPPASGWPLTEFAHETETTRAAAERAISEGYTLGKYADPTEDAREGLTAEEAASVAREDASLVYVVQATTAEVRLGAEESAILRRADALRSATMTEDESDRATAEAAEVAYLAEHADMLALIGTEQASLPPGGHLLFSDGTIARYAQHSRSSAPVAVAWRRR